MFTLSANLSKTSAFRAVALCAARVERDFDERDADERVAASLRGIEKVAD